MKKMRGFTKDGWVRVQRTVLRRVVTDRLQALLRGDFYVRNHLGEEDYEPIVKEVAKLNIPPPPPTTTEGEQGKATANAASEKNGEKNGTHAAAATATATTTTANGSSSAAPPSASSSKPQSPPEPQKFTPELETFIQLIAASIMIDASMRGENAGESDTRFIKKKKKLLAKTLAGPKLGDFQKEVLRFDKIKNGVEFEEEELVESEESKSSSSEEESESEEEEEVVYEIPKKKRKGPGRPPKHHGSQHGSSSHYAHESGHHHEKSAASSQHQHHHREQKQQREPTTTTNDDPISSSSEEESEASDTATSNTSLSRSGAEDGFSTSATSSKHHSKSKERKRLKKEKKRAHKREKKRMKKEKRRREKEEKKRKRKREKERLKEGRGSSSGKVKKRKKSQDEGALSFADNELSENDVGGMNNGHYDDDDDEDEMEYDPSYSQPLNKGSNPSDDDDEEIEDDDDEPRIYEIATKQDFDNYKSDVLSRVPKNVKNRFREGGFSRWGKDWLPVLELGPFDVEPGPVRDMWLEMFDNTQENGRDMTRLVFWYGVKFEDRGQAYSFVPGTKIMKYEEGQRKGYHQMPKKIQKKIEKKQKLTKTEEQIRRGLKEIEADMQRDKSDRAAWMMQFKEDYELAEEEAAQEEAEKKIKSMSVGEDDDSHIPKKRKPGRPKKDGSDKPTKRKPGRPKKVVEPEEDEEEDEIEVPKKRKPGRPKKSDKEKAEKAAAKAAAKAKKKESTAKKWLIVDEDQESEMETDDDEDDRDYDEDVDSGDDSDLHADDGGDSDDGRKSSSKKRKALSAVEKEEKKAKKKAKAAMTEEEKAVERRAKAAEYREKKAREKAEALGIPYVKGRVGRKSKAHMLEEEQFKFTKCEEVFCPMMDRLTEAKEESNVKGVLKCINSIMERVDLLTPPFLREYPLGMLVKTVRKTFEGDHPKVKDQCKRLTVEMKRVYSEKEPKIPDGFEPVKNKKSKVKEEDQSDEGSVASDSKSEKPSAVKSEKEKVAVKSEKAVVKSEKVPVKLEKVDAPSEQSIPRRNNSEMSLPESVPRKMAAVSSSECLPEAVKPEPPQPKQKKMFSIKGMFEKPKPAPKPKIVAPTPSVVVSGQPSPKPKSLPSWVTGPAMKMEDFHEQHAKERTFGLEFLVDAASRVTATNSAKRFDPVSVSQSFELAIFAETKLRGRNWQQYWEKVHDVVAMLSPGKNERNAILQGIICGDYQEPSELVKLSRREIQSLNRLKS